MRTALFTLLLISTLLAGSGRADDRVEDAKRFFYSAQMHYKLGEFDQALHDFQDAYRLQQDAALLFNIAQCYRRMGRLDDALRSFQFYVRDGGQSVNREAIQKLIAELEQQIAERDRAARKTAAAIARPADPGANPAPPATLTAAPPTLAVTATPARPRRALIVGGSIVGALGLGMLAGGIGTAVLASQNSDDLTALDRARLPFDPALDDSRKTNTAVSATLLSFGGAAIVCASVLIGVGRAHRSAR